MSFSDIFDTVSENASRVGLAAVVAFGAATLEGCATTGPDVSRVVNQAVRGQTLPARQAAARTSAHCVSGAAESPIRGAVGTVLPSANRPVSRGAECALTDQQPAEAAPQPRR